MLYLHSSSPESHSQVEEQRLRAQWAGGGLCGLESGHGL